nr:alanine dehydrogenase [Lachnoclostridium phocaeense]
MKVGILKDIKVGENRVIATPVEIASLKADGHEVYVQKGAGQKAGFPDEKYAAAGAVMVDTAEEIYRTCDFVAKVKEFEPSEYNLLREGQIVFTCIHPAAHPEEVQALLDKKVIAFTAEDSHRYGSPNCEAAGKQAALSVLHALGAWVTVADINIGLLRTLQSQYNQSINTMISSRENIAAILPETDMILNCVKWPKGNTEYLVTREMVRSMEPGSVLVDISNDEQGAIETFHETTHENPRYVEEGVVHYCVSNIPGAIANSTSVAYAASVLPHFRSILNNGVAQACAKDGFLRRSLTTYKGYLTHEETSALQNRPWIRPEDILGIADQKLDPAPPATVTRSDNFISP